MLNKFSNFITLDPKEYNLGVRRITPKLKIDLKNGVVTFPRKVAGYGYFCIKKNQPDDTKNLYKIVAFKCGKDDHHSMKAPKGKKISSFDLAEDLAGNCFLTAEERKCAETLVLMACEQHPMYIVFDGSAPKVKLNPGR